MRIMMLVASAVSYFINDAIAKARFGNADKMNFEAPLTSLVWITSIVSVVLTFIVSCLIIPALGGDTSLWWKLCDDHFLRHARRSDHSRNWSKSLLDRIAPRQEVVTSSREGGASLNILSGLVAGNFSAYWLGISIVILMSIAYIFSTMGLDASDGLDVGRARGPVFAFGLVAFGFLGMGPVTIAVDSYGPVTDNAQSVYELSLIEQVPNVEEEIQRDFNMTVEFRRAPNTCWRRTTAPAIHSKRRPSPC